MYFREVLAFSFLLSCASAYVAGGLGHPGYGHGGPVHEHVHSHVAEIHKPIPYSFGYDAPSDPGSNHFRKETGDGNGGVVGSYGYTDKQGLYRVVDYTAGAGGFHANVKTNEPGTDGKENPANVNLVSQAAPGGLVHGPAVGHIHGHHAY